MPQVARRLKYAFLRALPEPVRLGLLERVPNLRKSAPRDRRFCFHGYLGGYSVKIDTRFNVERKMWSGSYDPGLEHLFGEWIRPDSVCFDVGANAGATTLAMAKAMQGGNGKVYAFEPAPPTFSRLEANLALNPAALRQVVPVNLGLGPIVGVR